VGIIILVIVISALLSGAKLRANSKISSNDIQQLMQEQVDIGPRYPGSNGSLQFRDWVLEKVSSPWQIKILNFTLHGESVRNFLITSGENWPTVLIGAHYDSRKVADKDPNNKTAPVPAANDGASGVAGILEMLDHIPVELRTKIGFVLFDAEDQGSGGMSGWNWIEGSNYFVRNQMTSQQINQTKAFILFDMIANPDLKLEYEGFSDHTLRESIWNRGHQLGYGKIFVKQQGYYITDDHNAFVRAGIPSVDIIDLKYYPYHHTTKDDMAHVSAEKAAIVVDTTLSWLITDYFGGTVLSSSPTTQSSSSVTDISATTTQPSVVWVLPVIISVLIVRKLRNSSS